MNIDNYETVKKIAERYEKLCESINEKPEERITTIIDLEKASEQFDSLNLDMLLNSTTADFAHDIFGIKRHINRKTGIVENCFLPRCA